MKHVAMWACAMATFAGPISWALFYSSDDAKKPGTVAERGCAKCPGPAANSTEASTRDANPWGELGTTRTTVIFVTCGVWITCLWLHTRRLHLATRERADSTREPARSPAYMVSKSLQTIVDVSLPQSDNDSQVYKIIFIYRFIYLSSNYLSISTINLCRAKWREDRTGARSPG